MKRKKRSKIFFPHIIKKQIATRLLSSRQGLKCSGYLLRSMKQCLLEKLEKMIITKLIITNNDKNDLKNYFLEHF